MKKFKELIQWFNRPAQIFEILGYVFVMIGILIAVVGVLILMFPDKQFSGAIVCLSPIIGIAIAFVIAQPFFAISKVIKAAEKYLKK